jgi:hypothetical protein
MPHDAGSRVLTEDDDLTLPEKEFLNTELARIQPPERFRDLSEYSTQQLALGGGFYGMLPDQLQDLDSIPLPADEASRLEIALYLARQRETNLEALKQINPDYAITFRGRSLLDFLEMEVSGRGDSGETPEGIKLTLDISALTGFITALDDGEITGDEAVALAELPSNQAMLQHRRNLGYVPEPLPDTQTLAEMIKIAGSPDPLDRIWCWINSQNAFGYADLVQNKSEYMKFLSEIEEYRDLLTAVVMEQIGEYVSPEMKFTGQFAFTVGWAIRGWVTPDMAGLNVEQTKDDWYHLFGTLVEETYHQMQLDVCPTINGTAADEFSDLVAVDTGDKRYDRLYEIITYTVLEGSANLVRGRFAAEDLEDKAPMGAEIMARFVGQIIDRGDTDSADALISEGLVNNGPLYSLGWKLASMIEAKDGKRAIDEYLRRGPVDFFIYGAALSVENGESVLSSEVLDTVNTLREKLGG